MTLLLNVAMKFYLLNEKMPHEYLGNNFTK